MLLVSSDYAASSSRWNYDRHGMNGRHTENGFSTRDDADDDEIVHRQVEDRDEMTRRSESPILRPLPSMSLL